MNHIRVRRNRNPLSREYTIYSRHYTVTRVDDDDGVTDFEYLVTRGGDEVGWIIRDRATDEYRASPRDSGTRPVTSIAEGVDVIDSLHK